MTDGVPAPASIDHRAKHHFYRRLSIFLGVVCAFLIVVVVGQQAMISSPITAPTAPPASSEPAVAPDAEQDATPNAVPTQPYADSPLVRLEVHDVAFFGEESALAAVQTSSNNARQVGINSVPFFLLGNTALAGAQPIDVYREYLDNALSRVPYTMADITLLGTFLGGVLTIAAVNGNALYGGVVLLLFAAGMALPLLLLALLWGRLPFVRRLVRPREVRIGHWRNSWAAIIGGALTIGLGILLLVTWWRKAATRS